MSILLGYVENLMSLKNRSSASSGGADNNHNIKELRIFRTLDFSLMMCSSSGLISNALSYQTSASITTRWVLTW